MTTRTARVEIFLQERTPGCLDCNAVLGQPTIEPGNHVRVELLHDATCPRYRIHHAFVTTTGRDSRPARVDGVHTTAVIHHTARN